MKLGIINKLAEKFWQLSKIAQEAVPEIPSEVQDKLDQIETLWDNFRQSAYNVQSREEYENILDLFDTIKSEIIQATALLQNYPELNHLEDQLRETYSALKEDMDDLEEELNEYQGATREAMSGGTEEQAQKAFEQYNDLNRKRQAKWWNKQLPITRREIRRKKYEAQKQRFETLTEEEKKIIRQKQNMAAKPNTPEKKRKRQQLEQTDARKEKRKELAKDRRTRDIFEKLKKLQSL